MLGEILLHVAWLSSTSVVLGHSVKLQSVLCLMLQLYQVTSHNSGVVGSCSRPAVGLFGGQAEISLPELSEQCLSSCKFANTFPSWGTQNKVGDAETELGVEPGPAPCAQ